MSKISKYKPKIQLAGNKKFYFVNNTVKENKLHTICESGKCPNKSECWGRGTATFMILGNTCTRSCKFCNVQTGKPLPPDNNEITTIAESIKLMQLKHAVITSVTRDDLPDGGADFWKAVILNIKRLNPETTIETLIPDFKGVESDLDKVIEAAPEIISHNIETVKRLTKYIRIQAKYERSLAVLKYLASKRVRTKSGIMIGLGETLDEIATAMDDLLLSDCKILTIGQYLQPTKAHAEVQKYHTPEYFDQLKTLGLEKGFEFVESSSLVRSSYRAEQHIV